MKLAIFDIDGTLVEGSTERRFWRYLLKRGHQGPRQVVAYLLFWLRYLPVFGRLTAKKNKAYLYKLETARVRALRRGSMSVQRTEKVSRSRTGASIGIAPCAATAM